MIGPPATSPRRIGLVLIGLALSAAAAVLAVRGVDFDRTVDTLRTARLEWLIVALAVLAIQLAARARRWRLLLPADGPERVRIRRIVPVTLVGYLGNAVLPARLGEALRGVVLARRESLPTAETLGSVVLERMLDTLVLAIVGVVAALIVGVPDWIMRIGAIGVAVSIVGLVIVASAPRLLTRVRIDRVRRLVDVASRFAHGARVVRHPGRLAAAVGLCFVAWLLDAAVYWLAARSIGIELPPAGAVLVSAVTVLSTAVPSAPGYVGTFELAAVAVAAVLGVDPSTALAFALIAHGVAVLPIATAGAVALVAIGADVRLARLAPVTEPRGKNVTAPELSIVLPVYNEGEAVEPVLRALSSGVSTPHELVVVYDFDEDTTVPVLARLAGEIPGLRGHRNALGRGVLNAMKAGIEASVAPYVLISMADGSDEPHVVDRMVALARGGADVVAASRYMPGGRQVGGPPLKRLMSRTAGLTLHWFGGVPTHDPTNNFKLYSRSFLDAVTIESTAGFELALELTVKASLTGRPVAEVPTTWRDRTAGASNFKLRKWLPHYLHWYRVAFAGRVGRLRRRGVRGA